MHYIGDETSSWISSDQVIPNITVAVKELIENSLDANCDSLVVTLTNYGAERIEITDDGAGIHPDDIDKIGLPGYTSKIKTFQDLGTVVSLGFRGQGIPALCYMAQLEVVTKQDGQNGFLAKFDASGNVTEKRGISCKTGTVVTLNSLFHNLPVRQNDLWNKRKSYLKSIVQMLEEYSLCFPCKKLSLVHAVDKKRDHLLLGRSGSLLENIEWLFSKDLASSLLEVHIKVPEADAILFISNPSRASFIKFRRNFIFLNKRPIDLPGPLKSLLRTQYKEQSPGDLFFILSIHSQSPIGCNMSTDKRIVSIPFLSSLTQELKNQLSLAFIESSKSILIPAPFALKRKIDESGPTKRLRETPAPKPLFQHSEPAPLPNPTRVPKQKLSWSLSAIPFKTPAHPRPPPALTLHLRSEFKKSNFPALRVLGQFNNGFIIALLDSTHDLFVIDQHAANEKFLFETLQSCTQLHSQPLLSPQPLPLPLADELLALSHLTALNLTGFELQVSPTAPPGQRLLVFKIPFSKSTFFTLDDLKEAIQKLQQFAGLQDAQELARRIRPAKFRSLFASRACRQAVMIGTPLTHSAMRKILNDLSTLQSPWHCPHGRPTIRLLSNLE